MLGKRHLDSDEFRGTSREDRRSTTERSSSSKIVLDIEKMRNTIVNQIKAKQVTIISGETGCGKSTQVPQYILQDALESGMKCKILCTQPRRIACISIAKRVADEMGQEVGDMVGYHISMDVNLDSRSKIIFVTNGILLNYLTHNPAILTEYTHILIDEVHERDIDSDFVLILFKLFLNEFKSLKLILMSATINAGLFAKYFSDEEIFRVSKLEASNFSRVKSSTENVLAKAEKADAGKNWGGDDFDYGEWEVKDTWKNKLNPDNKKEEAKKEEAARKAAAQKKVVVPEATVLEIDSRRKYDIKTVYMDELNHFYNFNTDLIYRLGDFTFNKKRAVFIIEVAKICIQLIEYLHTNEKRMKFPNKKIDNGGILIFLPGLNEITYFIQMMKEMLSPNTLSELEIVPLHSTIAQMYEKDIFSYSKNVRKVIVSTNIAESSLTIPDIIFVMDFCLTKEFKFDTKIKTEKLDLTWASKASCRQRTGRTGRVCDGVSFRMVPKEYYDRVLDPFNEAEILRSPLDKVILKICVLHEEIIRKNDSNNVAVSALASRTAEQTKINEIFMGIAKKVFCDPCFVLDVALEKPTDDQIDYALHFLKENGCYIMPNNTSREGTITYLGRVYSDLPCALEVVKLLLYGHMLECFDEILTIAVLSSHPKSLWQPNNFKKGGMDHFDFLSFYRRLDKISDDQFSDHILYLNLFKDWWEHFGEQNDLTRYGGRRVSSSTNSRINPRLRQSEWYKMYNIRQNYMAEILANRQDLRRRMSKFISIGKEDRKKLKEKSELYMKIKVCIAAAYIPNYAIGVCRPTSKQVNELNNIETELKLDPVHTINIYGIQLYTMLSSYSKTALDDHDRAISEKYEAISDDEKINIWRNELLAFVENKYGPVVRIVINPRVAYVQFASENSDLSIRSFLFEKNYQKGLTSKMSVYSVEKGMTSIEVEQMPKSHSFAPRTVQNMARGELLVTLRKEIKAMIEGISDVSYNYSPIYDNPLNHFQVNIETKSMTAFLTRARNDFKKTPESEKRSLIIYSEETHNSGRNPMARNSSLMPGLPMFFEYMMLLFGHSVYLLTDMKNERVTHIKYITADIPINYWVTKNDILMINKIRERLKEYFESPGQQKNTIAIWPDLMILILSSSKEPFVQVDMWYDYFLANHYKALEASELTETDNFGQTFDRPEENTFDAEFMNRIKVPCDMSHNKEFMHKMKEYVHWKRSTLKELDNIQYEINCKKSFILCNDPSCRREIAEINAMKNHLEQECFRVLGSHSRPSVKLDTNLGAVSSEIINQIKEMKAFGFNVEGLFLCYSGHFFGYKITGQENNVCIYRNSPLLVKFQDLTTKEYLNSELNMEALYKEDSMTQVRKTAHLKNFSCDICNPGIKFANDSDLAYHLFSDKKHKEKLEHFLENLN